MLISLPLRISLISIILIACSQSNPNTGFNSPETTTEFVNFSYNDFASRNIILDDDLSPKETLGKLLFFDTNLSEPSGQSCASCHAPQSGFADPDKMIPVSEGVIPDNFGMRNALSASYVKFIPSFDVGITPADTIGGLFWDGRKIDLEDQAKAPFLNPLEMNNPSFETVVNDVMAAMYAPLFLTVYGPTAFDDPAMTYEHIADAIAAFERSEELNEFSSKYDYYKRGLVTLSAEETLGLTLFTGKAHCDHCHKLNSIDNSLEHDLFTDFKYANIGLPRNLEFPYDLLPAETIDMGLGAITLIPEHNGKFKTPHLRNIEETGPYMHNGLFKNLEDVVRFYNTRDVPGMWPAPEVSDNMATGPIGSLGLTPDEEEAIVEFMETLTDGFKIPPPPANP